MQNIVHLPRARPEYDPLVLEMLNRLPAPGATWPVEQRLRWMRALSAIFDLIYETECPLRIEARP